ncbi:MAG: lyase [Gemmatimonadota bacterium]|nr:lyase [Gemmatimonadota bacterium]
MFHLAALLLLPGLWRADAGAIAAGSEAAPDTVSISEWTVPWEKSRPRDPYVDGQGRVWFVGQAGNYIAYLDPKSGEFKRYEIEAGTHPHNLIIDAQGAVWYAGNRNAHIGKLDPATGKITKFAMPDTAARDPHTLVFDRAGDIWFTVQGGNFVGKLATKSGQVQLVKVPTARARPYGIVVDSKNRPWFNEFGTNKIATIDPATMALKEYPLPHEATRGRRIGITSDDKVWYVDYSRGYLARLDPATGKVDEWPTPSGARSLPYAMTVDDRDRIWYVETGIQPNRLVGFDPKTQQVFSTTEIKQSGAGTVRHMVFHTPTREIWFGTDANTIGRAAVP